MKLVKWHTRIGITDLVRLGLPPGRTVRVWAEPVYSGMGDWGVAVWLEQEVDEKEGDGK